jgi:ABC-2 type transport system permease protein
MKNLFRIWLKEYLIIFSDIGSLLVFFGAIIIYPFFYPLPYTHEVLTNVPVAVVDMNQSQLSHQLTRMLDSNQFIDVTSKALTFDQAKTSLIKGEINGIIYIPEPFEKLVLRGEQALISVYSDASYFLIYKQVLSGIYHAAGTFSAGIEIKRMMARGSTQEQALSNREPLSLLSVPLFNAIGGYATYVVPAVLVLMLQQTLLIGIGLLSGTRMEKGDFKNTDPQYVSIVSLVLGKAFAYFSIYMVHVVYLFGILFRFYNFPQRGNPLDLVLFIIPYLFASIFLAQAISGFFKNREISMVILLFTSIPAIFLSGFSWPKSSMPDWLNHLAMLLPSTTGIEGFLRINQMGASLKDVGFNWGILLGLTAIYFMMAVISMEKQYNRPKPLSKG